jgi:hypothetical protein
LGSESGVKLSLGISKREPYLSLKNSFSGQIYVPEGVICSACGARPLFGVLEKVVLIF